MELGVRPTSTIVKGLSSYIPQVSKTVPYFTGLDKTAMGMAGLFGMKDAYEGYKSGNKHWANALAEGALSGMMITELAPAVKYANELAGRGFNFLNSPLTGKWTTFGNKQYRFKPGYLGMNGTPVESRAIKPKIRMYRGSRVKNSIDSKSYSSDFFTDSKEAASGYGNYITEVELPTDARIIEVDAKGNRWDLLGGKQFRQSSDLEALEKAKTEYSNYKKGLMKKYGIEPTEENSDLIDNMIDSKDHYKMEEYAEELGLDPDLLYDSEALFDFAYNGGRLKNVYNNAIKDTKPVEVKGLLEVPGLGNFENIDDIGKALAENPNYPYSAVAVRNVSDAADIGPSGFGTHTQYVVRKSIPRTQTGAWYLYNNKQ
jgi:hypothetical protein